MTNVNLSAGGPPETVLPDPDPALVAALDGATDPAQIRDTVRAHPDDPLAWAVFADSAHDEGSPDISVYAYYRVGYHRGLDLLRRHGWKGSGYVRWQHPSNRGFLRCLRGLAEMAEAIGETQEAQRCQEFLRQLDPEA